MGILIKDVGFNTTSEPKSFTLPLIGELAHHAGYPAIRLMAMEPKVPLYEELGYRPLRDNPSVKFPGAEGAEESYVPTTRPILSHVRTERDQ